MAIETHKRFKSYIDVLCLAQKAIGIEKRNKKQLVLLEEIKDELIVVFEGEGGDRDLKPDEIVAFYESDENIRPVWLRFDDGFKYCKVPGRMIKREDMNENVDKIFCKQLRDRLGLAAPLSLEENKQPE